MKKKVKSLPEHLPVGWVPKCAYGNGVVVVEKHLLSAMTLVGASCLTTLIPGQATMDQFRIFLGETEELVLIRAEVNRGDYQGLTELQLIHVTKNEDGKWFATADPTKEHGVPAPAQVAGRKVAYQLYPDGIEVLVNQVRYVNYRTAKTVPGYKTRLVRNTSLLLQYIVGKVTADELHADSQRLTLRNPPLPEPVSVEALLLGHRATIQGLLDSFGDHLEAQQVAWRGSHLAARIAKREGSPSSFYLFAETMRDNPHHPSKQSVMSYDFVDGGGSFASETSTAVKGITNLSRRREDNSADYGAVLSEDGLFASAASLTLILDPKALRSEAGQKDFGEVVASLLMLEGARYISFSAEYAKTLRVFQLDVPEIPLSSFNREG